jgi:hypothetical protein
MMEFVDQLQTSPEPIPLSLLLVYLLFISLIGLSCPPLIESANLFGTYQIISHSNIFGQLKFSRFD